MTSPDNGFQMSCPRSHDDIELIKLGHGSGGRMTDQLIDQIFMPYLRNEHLCEREDAALLSISNERLAFTTDSYVVSPIIFPGGNIGSLSVHGTVNDLCMRGAKPQFISAAFIIEEGLKREILEAVVQSMQTACLESGVVLACADTKVVNRGCADKLFITTAGIGLITQEHVPSAAKARPGDIVICSGDIGRHGMAIMAVREGLEFDTIIESDSASLNTLAHNLCKIGPSLHVMRDITRGGLASVLNEIAVASSVGIEIDEDKLPLDARVRAACELLGLDPLYVACEGRLVAIVEPEYADEALLILQQSPHGEHARKIGKVVEEHSGRLVMTSLVGGKRIVDKLSGQQLPRIC